MLYDTVQYISRANNKPLEIINLAILINNVDETAIPQIIEIAKSVRSIKIVTDNIKRLSYIENDLYMDYGIAIQITNNKEKALSNSDIIINYDFDEYKVNRYNIMLHATVVNIKQKIDIKKNEFKGDIINDYDIEYDDEILKEFEKSKEFDNNIFYESLVYRKDTFFNIRKQLDKDAVKLARIF